MINVMLVAGDNTPKLAEFLVQRGTFSLDFSYRSLTEEIMHVKDSIINVDKLIYLLDNQQINIRTEMQLLKELLTSEGFFTVREIIFIVTENTEADKAIRYFNAVMVDSNYTNFTVHKTKAKVSFSEIYDYVIGVSVAENYKNTFKDVYRVERNSDSTVAYMPADDVSLKVEPFSYDSVNMFEEAKANSKRTESGILHKDEAPDSNIEQFDNPNLGSLAVIGAKSQQEIIVVSGDKKTGVSTWAGAVAQSAVAAGKVVTLFDFTDNGDIANLLKANNLEFCYVRMLEMLRNYQQVEDAINLVVIHNEVELSVRVEFLQHLFIKRNTLSEVCVIALPENLLETVSQILHNEKAKLLYCINPIFSDIAVKHTLIEKCTKQLRTFLVLNTTCKLLPSMAYVSKGDILMLLPYAIQIIQAIDFSSLDLDSSLFISLQEV